MRINLFSILCLVLLVPARAMAVEPINEVHAMFYYQIPFSGSKVEQKKHSFGFRMDRANYEYGEMIQYQQLMHQTAAFDFKMGHEGVQGLYVTGVDYLQLYRLNRAAEDENGKTDDGSTEAEQSNNPLKEVAGNIGETIDEVMDIIPLGFLIGGAVVVVLATGAGN